MTITITYVTYLNSKCFLKSTPIRVHSGTKILVGGVDLSNPFLDGLGMHMSFIHKCLR